MSRRRNPPLIDNKRGGLRKTLTRPTSYIFAVSSLHQGRIAIVTDAGWDAVDAAAQGANGIAGRASVRERSTARRRPALTPSFKLWLAANDPPRVRGTDKALWRRIRVIPFNVQIPEREVDKDLPQVLKHEWPGILAWAVRGCLDWQKEGLKPPKVILTASGDWAKASDHLKRFVTETLIDGPGNQIPAGDLYGNYEGWCRRNGETALSTNKFKQALMTAHNISHKRTKKGSSWIGVKYRM